MITFEILELSDSLFSISLTIHETDSSYLINSINITDFRLEGFYVNYKNGWIHPRRPRIGSGRREPPDSEIEKLTKLADALEKTRKELG